MKLFGKRDNNKTPVQSEKNKTFGPTRKKKNTYIVKISDVMANLSAWELCQMTPLAVIVLNGETVQNTSDWLHTTQFPNPGANNMVNAFDTLKPVMGEKLASTIVEYLDKETGEPVLQLYPTNIVMACVVNPLERMNHASRQDMNHQIQIRNKFINQINTKQK